MSRLQKQPILYEDKLKVHEKYLRFATPEVVALYRAERLCSSDFANTKFSPRVGESFHECEQKVKCNEWGLELGRACRGKTQIVEIGAGIGGQTFAFAKVCKKVLAIESDKSSANILIQNLKKLKIENVEVLVADATSKKAVERIKHFQPDIIFCDTERPEKAERTLEAIKPSIKKILEFSEITPNIAIEIPPYTDTEKLNEEYEKEFISINQQLNRLTLYFNDLKQDDVSVIALPSEEKLISRGGRTASRVQTFSPRAGGREWTSEVERNFIYSINPAIILANLVSELSSKFNAEILELNKPVLLSNEIIKSDFLTGYKIIAKCKDNEKDILQNLKKIDAGKIILRYNINPENYWKTRNSYEKELNGKREISLFIDEKNNKAIICEGLQ